MAKIQYGVKPDIFKITLGPFVEFWWCLKRRGPEMCAFGVLGLSCEAPAAPPDRGFARQPESPNVHISGSRPSKTQPKIQRKDPKKREERKKLCREREKDRNFGRSGGGEVRPNLGRTHENLEHPTDTHPHLHTTHLTTTQHTRQHTRQHNTTQHENRSLVNKQV